MVTLKMLAKECGVSVATVSKALNGAPDISAETAARIQKAAAEMGYTPCAAARYLKDLYKVFGDWNGKLYVYPPASEPGNEGRAEDERLAEA